MIFVRKIKPVTSILWVLLISMTLICAQGTKLHVHYLDCQHDTSIGLLTITEDNHGHAQHGKIHLAANGSYDDHSEEGTTELDVSPQGLLKNLSSVLSLLLVITSFFMLLLPEFTRLFLRHNRDSCSIAFWRYVLSPPLRAPPQP